jgi:hypothetical protein
MINLKLPGDDKLLVPLQNVTKKINIVYMSGIHSLSWADVI